MNRQLTASDPEPGPSTVVRDFRGLDWVRCTEGYWVRVGRPSGDPESWVKIAGNYGPVTVMAEPEREWRPAACPLARDQGYGYRHFHSADCEFASPEQIETDREYLEQRRWRNRLRNLLHSPRGTS